MKSRMERKLHHRNIIARLSSLNDPVMNPSWNRQEEKLENETNADGPLDLTTTLNPLSQDSKPMMTKSNSHSSFARTSEPLQIGTPFDSPDSNDDDKSMILQDPDYFGQELRRSSRDRKSSPSPPPHKLCQPYCFDNEKEKEVPSWKRGAQMNAVQMRNQNASIFRLTPLSTPPHRASPPTAVAVPALLPISRTRGRERSQLPCEVCGKAFDRPSLLKRHLRTHTGEKPHVCDVCSKGFSTSSSLNTHRRIHSGEKPHQCPICGKRFTASSNLYYHRMTHNKEKPHKCMLCEKSFPTPGDLKSHQYVHSGSWPYTCHVCHRGFSRQTNLRNHLLIHSGENTGMAQLTPRQNPLTSFGLISLPGNTLAASSFHFPPTSSVNPIATTPNSVTAAAATALFRNAGGGSYPATNPFIEHLMELNYRT